jgi:16S rRNA (guanine527-N7)-methyltransferase
LQGDIILDYTMDEQFTTLKDAIDLGIKLSPAQMGQFETYARQLIDWNERINLTSITQPSRIYKLHFLDSLTACMAIPNLVNMPLSVCDVGSGAGFPGIPLKIAFPAIRLTLVDSISKRTDFLKRIVSTLGLDEVTVVTDRSESIGQSDSFREDFDVVVSRAVAETRILLEYTLPLCRISGRTILLKKGDVMDEMRDASAAMSDLGGTNMRTVDIPTEILDGDRKLIVVDKLTETPSKYPRRIGIPAKRPL